MGRTVGAVAAAAVIGLIAVSGLGVVLGFPAQPSLVAGVLAALVLGGVVLAAAARSGSLEGDQVTPPRPRHPGPPDQGGTQ